MQQQQVLVTWCGLHGIVLHNHSDAHRPEYFDFHVLQQMHDNQHSASKY